MIKDHRDPVTGDALSFGEYVSWCIQGVIRRWAFLIAVSLITALVWSTNNPVALTWWNLGASYLAIFIESVVGLAMFNQTRRDAVIIRRIDRVLQLLEDQQTQEQKELEQIERDLVGEWKMQEGVMTLLSSAKLPSNEDIRRANKG